MYTNDKNLLPGHVLEIRTYVKEGLSVFGCQFNVPKYERQ